jgi:hypothetical protein
MGDVIDRPSLINQEHRQKPQSKPFYSPETECLHAWLAGSRSPNVVQTTVIKYPGCYDCSSDDIKRALEALLNVK